jgi:serine/threonine-protein kinase
MGSAPYLSPEQARDASQVDHRSDIWALGVVLHRLVTGRRPFEATTTSGYIATIVADPPIPLSEHRPDVHPALAAVVARCLRKDPEQRFQDVASLAVALAGLAPEHARLLEGFVASEHPARSLPLPVALPVALPVEAPLASADAASQATIGPVETRTARTGGPRWQPIAAVLAALALGSAGAVLYVGSPPLKTASPGLVSGAVTQAAGWAAEAATPPPPEVVDTPTPAPTDVDDAATPDAEESRDETATPPPPAPARTPPAPKPTHDEDDPFAYQ